VTTRRRQPMGRLHRDDPQRYEREGVAMDAPSQSPDRPSGQKPVLVGSWRHRVWSASSPGSVPPAARRARHAVPRGQLAVRGGDRAPRRGGRLRRGRRPGGAPAAAPQGMEPRHLSHRPALHVGRRPVTAYASATLGVGVVSVPALGAVAVEGRVREAVVRLVDGLLGETVARSATPRSRTTGRSGARRIALRRTTRMTCRPGIRRRHTARAPARRLGGLSGR
jgi:hypothetical protein